MSQKVVVAVFEDQAAACVPPRSVAQRARAANQAVAACHT
jgi:hypothetical protein